MNIEGEEIKYEENNSCWDSIHVYTDKSLSIFSI